MLSNEGHGEARGPGVLIDDSVALDCTRNACCTSMHHSTSGSCVWVLTVPPQVKKPPCHSPHWEPLWFFSDVFLLLSEEI